MQFIHETAVCIAALSKVLYQHREAISLVFAIPAGIKGAFDAAEAWGRYRAAQAAPGKRTRKAPRKGVIKQRRMWLREGKLAA